LLVAPAVLIVTAIFAAVAVATAAAVRVVAADTAAGERTETETLPLHPEESAAVVAASLRCHWPLVAAVTRLAAAASPVNLRERHGEDRE
jgi:hypothetical protein